MVKKTSYSALLVFCLVAVLSCSGRGGKTLVSVNGAKITEGDLDFIATINPRMKAQIVTPFGKKQIVENLVEQELLYQAATKRGLQRDSQVKAKIDLYKRVIISQAAVEDAVEKAVKEYYDQHRDEFEKLQLSHILIKYAQPEKDATAKAHPKQPKEKVTRTKQAALELAGKVKMRLDAKEDFAAVAKEASEDATSKNNGGDLGKASKNDQRFERRGYIPLLEKALTMQVGEISGPLETQEGYHIITVTKGLEVQSYEDAKQSILFKIQNDERNKLLETLKKEAKIVYAGGEEKKMSEEPVKPQEN